MRQGVLLWTVSPSLTVSQETTPTCARRARKNPPRARLWGHSKEPSQHGGLGEPELALRDKVSVDARTNTLIVTDVAPVTLP